MLSVSAFNDWSNSESDSLVWFRNDEDQGFTKVTLAHEPIQLLTIDFADFDGDGAGEIISGCFPSAPPFERINRFAIWKERTMMKQPLIIVVGVILTAGIVASGFY